MKGDELAEIVGRNVKGYRELKGISQEALGDQAGVHRTYVGLIEVGKKNVTITTLAKLAEALGIEPYEFLLKDSFKK